MQMRFALLAFLAAGALALAAPPPIPRQQGPKQPFSPPPLAVTLPVDVSGLPLAIRHQVAALHSISETSDRRRLAAGIARAASLARSGRLEPLAAALEGLATPLAAEEAVPLDALRAGATQRPLLAVVSVNEEGAAGLEVGLLDVREQAWLDVLVASLPQLHQDLGLPEPVSTRPPDTLVIATATVRGGVARHSVGAMTSLPKEPAARAAGSVGVIWSNYARAWFEANLAPAAQAVLVDEQAAMVTADAYLVAFAARHASAPFAPRTARGGGLEVDLDTALKTERIPLMIARADLVTALAADWLSRRGELPAAAADQALAMLVTLSFRALADATLNLAPRSHLPAARLLLSRARADGGLLIENGRCRIVPEKMRASLRSLLAEIAIIENSGDRRRARALLGGHASAPEIDAVMRSVPAARPLQASLRLTGTVAAHPR